MDKHLELYRKYGIRNKGSITLPKVILTKEWTFPKNSIWLWTNDITIPSHPRFDAGLMLKVKEHRTLLLHTYVYPKGRFTVAHNPADLLKEVKKLSRGKVEPEVKKIRLMRDNELLVVNAGCLNYAYKYNGYRGHEIDRLANRWRTLLETSKMKNLPMDRVRYLTINVPNLTMETLSNLEEAMKLSSRGILELMKDDESINSILGLWRLLTPKHVGDSPFSALNDKDKRNTVLMFRSADYISLFNLYDLYSMVDEYELPSTFSSKNSAKEVRKLLFLFMLKVKNANPVPIAEIEIDDISSVVKLNQKDILEDEDVVNNVDKLIQDSVDTSEPIPNEDTIVTEVTTASDILLTEETLKAQTFTVRDAIDRAVLDGKINVAGMARLEEKLRERQVLKDANRIVERDLELVPVPLPDLPHLTDKSMLKDTVSDLDTDYLTNVYRKDIFNTIHAFEKAGVIIEDFHVVETKDVSGVWEELVIKFAPIGGKVSTQVIRIAKVETNGTMNTNGNEYRLIKQIADRPFRKISPKTVVLSSYGGRTMINKAKYTKDDLGEYIKKRLTEKQNDPESNVQLVVALPSTTKDAKVNRHFATIGREVKTVIIGKAEYNFHYLTRDNQLNKGDSLADIEKGDYTLAGKIGKEYIIMDLDGVMWLRAKTPKRLGTLMEIAEIDTTNIVREFTTIQVFKVHIPTCVLLSFYLGFDSLVNILKVKHETYDAKTSAPLETNDLKLRFADHTLILRDLNPYQGLVMNGFRKLKDLRYVPFASMNNNGTDLMSLLDLELKHITEIRANETLFVDPITQSVLEMMNMPITFTGLILKANEALIDDNFKHMNDESEMYYRSYERIPGLIYTKINRAVRAQMQDSNYGKAAVKVNKFETWVEMANDSTMMISEDINPISAIKQTRNITYTGLGGRSIETMTPKTREFHKSMIGVASESSKDSSKVGVTFYASANPLIGNLRGLSNKPEYKDISNTSKLSVSAMNAPFSMNDDAKRVGFIDIQNGHTVGSKYYTVLPVRTGYETVIPMISGPKFAVVARQAGYVMSVSKKHISVQYADKSTEKYKIDDWYTKEESGTAHLHTIITTMQKGDKFKIGDGICYDSMFFGPDMLNPGGIAHRNGILLNTAYVESYGTYEDSYELTPNSKHKLGTTSIYISKGNMVMDDSIFTLVKVGTEVEAGDVLVQFGKDIDNQGKTKGTLELLKDISGTTVKSENRGVVKHIKVLYNGSLSEMSKSLQEIIAIADAELKVTRNDPDITGRVDSTFSDAGVPIADGEVIIKVYTQVDIETAPGNKIVMANQLKMTMGEYIPDLVTFYGDPVDLYMANASAEARIVDSPDKNGTLSTALVHLTRKFLEVFDKE